MPQTHKIDKRRYVFRSTYQKIAEENKRLLNDIKILTSEGISAERTLLIIKWRVKFKADKDFTDILQIAAKEYIKEHPEYDISSTRFVGNKSKKLKKVYVKK